MKIRIRQNVWGNWYGYAGSRRVRLFGLDYDEAKLWKATAERRIEQAKARKEKVLRCFGGPNDGNFIAVQGARIGQDVVMKVLLPRGTFAPLAGGFVSRDVRYRVTRRGLKYEGIVPGEYLGQMEV